MAQNESRGPVEVAMVDSKTAEQIHVLKALRWSERRIAVEVGVNRKTVKRYLAGAKVGEQVRPLARSLDVKTAERLRNHFLDEAGQNAVVAHELIKNEGVNVSIRTVQRVVSELRADLRRQDVATMRFETEPGEQMQVDFGEKDVDIAGRIVRIHFLVACLGYSRRLYVQAFLCERAEDWREAIAEAFKYFNGVSKTILIDNTRCLVASHDVHTGKVELQSAFAALCKDFGCKVRACRPYRARTKGKVESTVKFVKNNAIAKRRFSSFAEFQAHLTSWCVLNDDRVHGTTHEKPSQRYKLEQAHLQPLPTGIRSVRNRELIRTVSNDGFVNIDSVRYSVPYKHIRRKVGVYVEQDTVSVLLSGQLVAKHARNLEPHTTVSDPKHTAGLLRPMLDLTSTVVGNSSKQPPATHIGYAHDLSCYDAAIAAIDGRVVGRDDDNQNLGALNV